MAHLSFAAHGSNGGYTLPQIHIYPDTAEARKHAAARVGHTFMYTIDTTYGVMRGYKVSGANEELSVMRTWENVLDPVQDRIVAVSFKPKHGMCIA